MALAASLVKKVKALFKRGGLASDQATAVQLRDAVAGQGNADAAELARRLSAGDITLTTFQEELYLLTRQNVIAQYALARGGVGALTDADRTAIGKLVAEQAGYLRDFVAEIGKGGMAAEEIARRAALYPDAGIAAHARGQAAARGATIPVSPPIHPNCRCRIGWDGEGETQTWSWLTEADPCPICAGLASQYAGVAA